MKLKLYLTKSVITFCAVFVTNLAVAQFVKIDSTANWKKSFKAGITVNQASFSSNWTAGGTNSIGFTSILNFKAEYKKNKTTWANEFDLLFGTVRNAGQGYRKTGDRIYIDSKYGRKISEHWDFSAAINMTSQFTAGYKYDPDNNATLISDIIAPCYISTAFGLEYNPNEYFKLRISPYSPRVTIVKDAYRFVTESNPRPYGLNPMYNDRFEWLSAQILAEYSKNILENINLSWRYLLFANYENLKWKTIDHRLDLTITAKVNKFMNVTLGGVILYDKDQHGTVQYTQSFSLGVLYTYRNHK